MPMCRDVCAHRGRWVLATLQTSARVVDECQRCQHARRPHCLGELRCRGRGISISEGLMWIGSREVAIWWAQRMIAGLDCVWSEGRCRFECEDVALREELHG